MAMNAFMKKNRILNYPLKCLPHSGKMTPRRISGTCAKHQRPLALEIKRARQLAMLPMAPNHF